MWKYYALLSALFAALTAVLAKVGVGGIGGNVATAVRTAVVLALAWAIVIVGGQWREIGTLSQRHWFFLILSGLATGGSWLFYFKALETGEVAKVAPLDKLSVVLTMLLAFVFLRETVEVKTLVGGLLITLGAIIIAW
ncbi:membrane protein [Planctomycetales bacterium]|nr:membrane protein [Planctomycetales bacterium]GHS99975.1 membrane protein [Planctomycetales bacterium]GHT06462.1 membrane protein [Planctomycetales bacterium]GHV19275.1 membrane protein [Planctomycetales bacterium]